MGHSSEIEQKRVGANTIRTSRGGGFPTRARRKVARTCRGEGRRPHGGAHRTPGDSMSAPGVAVDGVCTAGTAGRRRRPCCRGCGPGMGPRQGARPQAKPHAPGPARGRAKPGHSLPRRRGGGGALPGGRLRRNPGMARATDQGRRRGTPRGPWHRPGRRPLRCGDGTRPRAKPHNHGPATHFISCGGGTPAWAAAAVRWPVRSTCSRAAGGVGGFLGGSFLASLVRWRVPYARPPQGGGRV